MTTHSITVLYMVEAPSRQQAEAWVQSVAVTPFKRTRRGTGQIVPSAADSILEAVTGKPGDPYYTPVCSWDLDGPGAGHPAEETEK